MLALVQQGKVSTLFNAPVHVKHLTELFESLSFDEVADFVVCQVADSTILNPKIAKDLGYPHVDCCDHCLNNVGKEMEKDTPDLSALVNSIHDVHTSITGSNKLSANLANAQSATSTCMKLKSKSITRWNNICHVLESNLKCKDFLKDIVKRYPTKFTKVQKKTVNKSRTTDNINKHLKYLQAIKVVSEQHLQPRGQTLADSQSALDFLCESILTGHGVKGDEFEFCELKPDKIQAGNHYDSNPDFVTGVIKLQQRVR